MISRATYAKAGVLFLLMCFIGVGAASIYEDSWTYDEPEHIAFGDRLLSGSLEHASMQKMPVTALNAIPLRVLRTAKVQPSPKVARWITRLPTVLVAAVMGYFIFAWSARLHGRKGGFLSLGVFLFCPNTIAHARLATTDIYCATFMLLAAYTFVRLLERPSALRLLAAAVAMGLAQLTKQTALLLFPLFAAVLVVRFAKAYRAKGTDARAGASKTKRVVSQCVVYVFTVLLIMNAGYAFKGTFGTFKTHETWLNETYPGAVAESAGRGRIVSTLKKIPLPLPAPYIETYLAGNYFNRTGGGHGPIYLLGHRSGLGWWYYFPMVVLLKTPLPILVLFGLALWAAVRSKLISRDSEHTLLLVFPAAIFLFFCFLCTAQLGIRYVLPCAPFVYVLIGQLARPWPRLPRRLQHAGIAGLLLWAGVSTFSYYPHFIAYFNEACPDRLMLYKYLADSNVDWGQDEDALAKYLATHQGQKISVSPDGPTTGIVIVRINDLVGVISNAQKYEWLRVHHRPVSHIGYSMLIYDI